MASRTKFSLLILLLTVALVVAVAAGNRSYRSFLLLQSASQAGAVETGTVRAWMTLGYVAESYSVDVATLQRSLGLPDDIAAATTLRAIAEDQGIDPFDYLSSVQAALAEAIGELPPTAAEEEEGWLDRLQSEFLSAVLLYGYPAFVLVLFAGALGLPVPTGLSTAVAGSLAGLGELDLAMVFAVAVAASAVGDVTAYGIGRVISPAFMQTYGRWFGYTARNRERMETLFARWGAVAVLATRTFASHLSSIASLLAGFHRYSVGAFFGYSIAGRILWTASYLGAGYLLGGQLEASSRLLGGLSVTLVAVLVACIAALGLYRARRSTSSPRLSV